jgi:hypothetical protein
MTMELRMATRKGAPIFALLGALAFGGCFGGHHGSAAGPAPVAAVKPAPTPAKMPTVVRPAPDFAWVSASGKATPLKSLRGQPVVLLIAPSPDEHALRKQADRIDHLYLELSAHKAVFVAAFTAAPGRVESNVPYAYAADGKAVGAAYGVPAGGFAVVVIGPKGNMDLISKDVEAAQRLLDIINNSYEAQSVSRTGLGS